LLPIAREPGLLLQMRTLPASSPAIAVVSSLAMVKEGYYFGVPPLLLGGLAIVFHGWILGGLLIAFALFCFAFFRDPERVISADPATIVSPADGKVVVITDEENAGRPGTRISIFLAIWNVHVNRSPAAGVITKVDYRPGKFLAAWDPNASKQNEQNVFTLATANGRIEFKQIAGLLARRVASWKKPLESVAKGERIGLVRFGSRVDLWVPQGSELLVKVGDNVHGGSSILAHWPTGTAKSSIEATFVAAERQS
jgi:phosphatidylserine decarboxylase